MASSAAIWTAAKKRSESRQPEVFSLDSQWSEEKREPVPIGSFPMRERSVGYCRPGVLVLYAVVLLRSSGLY